jgi:hypothetical protein
MKERGRQEYSASSKVDRRRGVIKSGCDGLAIFFQQLLGRRGIADLRYAAKEVGRNNA